MTTDERLAKYVGIENNWLCEWCDTFVEPDEVTFEETHTFCGHNVEIEIDFKKRNAGNS